MRNPLKTTTNKITKKYDYNWIVFQCNNHIRMDGVNARASLNKHYLNGDQYMKLSEDGFRVEKAPVKRVTKATANFFPFIMNLMTSKLLANMPVPVIVPFMQEKDFPRQQVARISNLAARQMHYSENISKKLEQVCHSEFLAGMGIWDVYYNKFGGEKIVTKAYAKMYGVELDGDIHEGEINFRYIPIHEFIPDPIATDDKTLRWVILRKLIPTDMVEQAFKLKEGSVVGVSAGEYGVDLNRYTLRRDAVTIDDDSGEDPVCILYEFRMLPDERYPKGIRKFCTGEREIHNCPNGLNGDGLGIFTFAPGRAKTDLFCPMPPADICQIRQRMANKFLSLTSENAEQTGVGKWLVKKGSVPNKKDFNDAVGRIYWTQERPFFQAVPPLPDYIVSQIFTQIDICMKLYGLVEPGAGRMGPRMTGAPTTLVETLIQQEATVFSGAVRTLEEFIGDSYSYAFYLMQKYYSNSRKAAILGEDMEPILEEFDAAHFAEKNHVIVTAGGGLGQSPQSLNEENYQLAKDGFITPQQYFQARYDFGNLRPQIERMMLDKNKARWNLELIKTSKKPEELNENMLPELVTEYDDIDVHIKIFSDYTKTLEYRGIIGDWKAIFIKGYLDYCKALKQSQIQEQIQRKDQYQQPQEGPGGEQSIYDERAAEIAGAQSPGPPPLNLEGGQ